VPSFAWADLYLALGTLIPRFQFEAHDVVRARDVDYVGDFFIGMTSAESKGIRIMVKRSGA
jgi:hypothetical protein